MATFNLNLNPGQLKSVGCIPADANENPATFDAGTPITASTPGPIAISTGSPMSGFAQHLILQATPNAAPGVYPVNVVFKVVAGGPDVTSSFNVTVPSQPATHLNFAEI